MKILTDPRSGSYQGITSSRNRFGQYVRTRATPVQPRTPKATALRAQLTTASSAWRSLSDAQRTAWNDYAAQIGYTDSLGQGYNPTGAALYVGSSITAQSGGSQSVAPAELPNYVLTISDVTYTDATPGPEAMEVQLGITSADNYMLVETSGPVSPGITSAAAVRRWRTLPVTAENTQAVQYAMSANPVDIIAEYRFLYPSPVPGQVIWLRFKEIFYATNGVAVTNRNTITWRLVIV